MSSTTLERSLPLLLVPTEIELRQFANQVGFGATTFESQTCGFGPIAAAARTSQLIEQRKPSFVVLAGIAGTYDSQQLDIGQAACFEKVAVFGIGSGSSEQFTPASATGFAQWPGEDQLSRRIEESIELCAPGSVKTVELLLTCCAISEDEVEIQHRLSQFPTAVAEDMEGFGVAMACTLAGVRLTIIRGVSNRAGDRDKARWRIPEAIESAWGLVRQLLESDAEYEAPR